MKNYGIELELLNFSMLHTGVIYLLLWFVLQYYQVCLTIEKEYDYIESLEETLVKNGVDINREGKDYAKSYSLLKNVANFLYAWGIPIGIGSVAVIRAIKVLKSFEGNVICDLIGLAIIMVLSTLYFSDRNLNWKSFRENSGCKKLKGWVKLDV